MGKDVIVALDFKDKETALQFLDQFEDCKPFVKIGMELFYAEGPDVVREIKKRGHKIFLDLKLHDIPNTVEGGMRSLRDLGVDMTNVHAQGTVEMMKRALKGLTREDGTRPLLIAVTQLTSTSEEVMNKELGISGSMEDAVVNLARNAKLAGLDGVVCSPLESTPIHEFVGKDFVTVTPGIRFAEDSKGDQKRVTTPAKANEIGSDYIVVGRSITKASDPVKAYKKAMKDFTGREL